MRGGGGGVLKRPFKIGCAARAGGVVRRERREEEEEEEEEEAEDEDCIRAERAGHEPQQHAVGMEGCLGTVRRWKCVRRLCSWFARRSSSHVSKGGCSHQLFA